MRDIKNLFKQQEGDYQVSVRAGNFCCSNYIAYESNGDR